MKTAAASKYDQIWDLDSLLPHPSRPEFPTLVESFRHGLEALAERSDHLPAIPGPAASAAAWGDFLQECERLEMLAVDLSAFIGCHAAADAGNKLFRQYEASLSALDPLRERIMTNLEFALRDASEADFQAFVQSHPVLRANEFFLIQRRKNARLRLPRGEELLAADLAVDGIHAWGRLYDRISGELRIQVMEKGEIVEKSAGQIRYDSPERTVRQNNFYAADKAWKTVADHCADALNHIAGTRQTLYKRLGLTDHLEAPLHRNRMQRSTLDAMWGAITRRKSMLLKYLSAKARLLGVDQLSWYDTQAPLPGTEEPGASAEISYDAGADLVCQTFSAFSPDFGEFAAMSLKQRWIEAENRSGKRQGAFCTGFATKKQSRVFMTFTNSHDNVSTLAHELGHAYHSWVLRDQPFFLQDYPMNLAETASTFAEAVLAEQRLAESKSRGEKLAILDHMLADAVAYLMNIHARFLFENRFHDERRDGELSAARLSEIMLAAQKEAYLDALVADGWYPDFWVSKLHFYISGLPFYNFPYTFGYLLSTGLYALSEGAGTEFPDQYRRLLVATGCQETEAAVKSTTGYDLSGPAFWNKSLDVIERRIEQFLALIEA
ncbi:MAG: M3 family oligoendopeptidase [Planctomycetes bacterium]|nr:M3 family oligoendopeptidase [Planctomycetota bacterium]